MTLVRRLAVGVVEFVVRHASAGSRDWAEGLARECEEIPHDWVALGWALGSTRVLLDQRDLPFASLDAVRKEALETGERQDSISLFLIYLVGEPFSQILSARIHPWRPHNTLLWPLAAGSLLIALAVLVARRRERYPDGDTDWDWALYLRQELRRRTSWPVVSTFVLAVPLYCTALVMSMSDGSGALFWKEVDTILSVAGVGRVLWHSWQTRVRLEQLEDLLSRVAAQ